MFDTPPDHIRAGTINIEKNSTVIHISFPDYRLPKHDPFAQLRHAQRIAARIKQSWKPLKYAKTRSSMHDSLEKCFQFAIVGSSLNEMWCRIQLTLALLEARLYCCSSYAQEVCTSSYRKIYKHDFWKLVYILSTIIISEFWCTRSRRKSTYTKSEERVSATHNNIEEMRPNTPTILSWNSGTVIYNSNTYHERMITLRGQCQSMPFIFSVIQSVRIKLIWHLQWFCRCVQLWNYTEIDSSLDSLKDKSADENDSVAV